MEIQFAKSFMSYLKLKKEYDIITDTYLEEGEIEGDLFLCFESCKNKLYKKIFFRVIYTSRTFGEGKVD